MSGLILKLGPKERLLLNGVVIENGDRRARLTVLTPDANILRLKDALHPDDAKTPVRRVCYIAQMALCGEADPETAQQQLVTGISQLRRVFRDSECKSILNSAASAVAEQRFYPALKSLRGLIAVEDRLMDPMT